MNLGSLQGRRLVMSGGQRSGVGGEQDIPKLKASPGGGATIIRIVMAHFKMYGPMGFPNGRVVTQNLGHGNTPCLSS